MSCGQNRLALKIRLMKYVAKNPEWRCTPTCIACKYWETCYYEMLCEEGEIEERYEYEYRVRAEESTFYTSDYREAVRVAVEKRNFGYQVRLERRPIFSRDAWVEIG